MSLTCTKEFSLHVDPIATYLRAYWKCEDANLSTTWVDEVSDNDLIQAAGLKSTTGIISKGFTNNGGFLSASSKGGVGVPEFNFGGLSFTIRFWYFAYDNSALGDSIISELEGGGGTKECSIWRYGGGIDGIEWRVASNDNFWTGVDGLEVTGILLGWNRLIYWYENGVGFGMKLNNNADVLLADTSGFPSVNKYYYARVEPSAPAGTEGKMDEIGIWAKKWSAAEMLYDWNGGVGRTYPDVPI